MLCIFFHINGTLHRGYPTPGPVPVHSLLGTRLHSRRWGASEQSFICCSPSLPIAHVTAWTITRITTWTRPPPHPAPAVSGEIVFHETGPWCQKGWRPLSYTTCRSENSFSSTLYVLGLSTLINVNIVYHFYHFVGFHRMTIPKVLIWLFTLFQSFIIVNAVLLQQKMIQALFIYFFLVHMWKTFSVLHTLGYTKWVSQEYAHIYFS